LDGLADDLKTGKLRWTSEWIREIAAKFEPDQERPP
jgi:hypothetical protein